jgi:cytochrome c556
MRRLLVPLCLALAVPVQAADQRTAIPVNAEELMQVQTEMRGMLNGVSQIVSGVAANDMKAVAAAARNLGMAGNNHVPMSLRRKLPMEFKAMGHPTHVAFDDLARDAEALGDAKHTLKQLGALMDNCNACHETFRFVLKK